MIYQAMRASTSSRVRVPDNVHTDEFVDEVRELASGTVHITMEVLHESPADLARELAERGADAGDLETEEGVKKAATEMITREIVGDLCESLPRAH